MSKAEKIINLKSQQIFFKSDLDLFKKVSVTLESNNTIDYYLWNYKKGLLERFDLVLSDFIYLVDGNRDYSASILLRNLFENLVYIFYININNDSLCRYIFSECDGNTNILEKEKIMKALQISRIPKNIPDLFQITQVIDHTNLCREFSFEGEYKELYSFLSKISAHPKELSLSTNINEIKFGTPRDTLAEEFIKSAILYTKKISKITIKQNKKP